jgi:predicted extracellular nuclease
MSSHIRILLGVVCSLLGSTDLINAQERFQAMFYNVENYFDTVNRPDKQDDEFTPDGFKNWGFFKYRAKQNRIAKTIMAVGKWQMPDVIGLAEVENQRVLKDLLTFSPLERFNYQILHQQSPDWRGIDVALLYRPEAFKVVDSQFIEVNFPQDSFNATRDILYAKGIAGNQDTLHFYVNHWPSRYGGKAESAPKRARAASLLRQHVDSLYRSHPAPKIIITGDFNDGPKNKSLKQVLGAATDTTQLERHRLLNLMYPQANSTQKGSYKYQYRWHTFDQFIVSRDLVKAETGYRTGLKHARIYRKPFLMTTDKQYPGKIPHRTYLGPRYKDGYSDHLPVYLNLYTAQGH